MSIIKVFEGPLCCSTGVCGPAPEQALIDFTADARWLAEQGGQLVRAAYRTSGFAADATAVSFLRAAGWMPAAGTGRRPHGPDRPLPVSDELARYAGLSVRTALRCSTRMVRVLVQ